MEMNERNFTLSQRRDLSFSKTNMFHMFYLINHLLNNFSRTLASFYDKIQT